MFGRDKNNKTGGISINTVLRFNSFLCESKIKKRKKDGI
jgi:hypothetical protein